MDSWCAPTSPGGQPPSSWGAGEPTFQPQFSSAWLKAAPAGLVSWVLLECSEQAGPGKETSQWRTPGACNRSLQNSWGGPHLRGLWHHQHSLCMQVGGSRQTARQPIDVAPGATAPGDTDHCLASPGSWGAAVRSQEQPVRSVRTVPLCSRGSRHPPGQF